MPSYKQYKSQIEKLQKEAEAARQKESAGVVKKIRAMIAEFDLTAEDLGFSQGVSVATTKAVVAATQKKAPQAKKPSVPKYRDPKSGKTWTGHGKAPGWIVAARKSGKIQSFLIEKAEPEVKVAAVAKGTKPLKSAAKKPAAVKSAAAVKATPAKKAVTKSSVPAKAAPAAAKKTPAVKKVAVKAKASVAKPAVVKKPAAKKAAPAAKQAAAPAPTPVVENTQETPVNQDAGAEHTTPENTNSN